MQPAVSTPSSYPVRFSAQSLRAYIRLAGARLGVWLEARAARIGRAALYQELSKMSDAELARRGFPRGELHRCVSRYGE